MGPINYFKFEVLPYAYAGIHGGTEHTYQITIEVDGEEYGMTVVPREFPPNATETEYLIRKAVQGFNTIYAEKQK